MSTRSDSITALISVVSADVIATLVEDLATHLADAGDSLKEKLEEYFAVDGEAPPPPKGKGAKTAAKPTTAKGGKKPAAAPKVEGELVVVLNYGPKSHAIFGPTADIKDKLMALNKVDGKLVGYNGKLSFGPGWTIMNKDRLEEVTNMFTENELEFREVERKEYEAEVGGKPKAEAPTKAGKPASKANANPKPKAAPAKGPKAAPPTKGGKPAPAKGPKAAPPAKGGKAKVEPVTKLVAAKNKWGNNEESETGIVFMELPVGVAGRKISVAVGTQDAEAEFKVKGLASVLPLSAEMIEECETKKWRVLSDEVMATLLKKDKATHAKLTEMLAKADVEEEEAEEEPAEEEEAEEVEGEEEIEEAEEEVEEVEGEEEDE